MIYLHLGLHKTATTALQRHVFPNLEGLEFLGRAGGKIEETHELYKLLGRYVHSTKTDYEQERIIGEAFSKYGREHGHLLISEEWFTTDYSEFYGLRGAAWQDKLEKLSRIFQALDTKVFLTIRNPLEAMHSQYCEFHNIDIQTQYPTFMDYMLRSNDAKVFFYEALDDLLCRLFVEVDYLTFDEIKAGTYKVFIQEFFCVEHVADLKNENTKESNESGVKVRMKGRTVKLLEWVLSPRLRDRLKNVGMFRLINQWIEKRSNKTVEVPLLSERDHAMFERHFAGSRAYYLGLLSK